MSNITYVPKVAIARKFLLSNFIGPVKSNKMAQVFEGKKSINPIEQEAKE